MVCTTRTGRLSLWHTGRGHQALLHHLGACLHQPPDVLLRQDVDHVVLVSVPVQHPYVVAGGQGKVLSKSL